MTTFAMFKLKARNGVELWRLISGSAEHFVVRFSHRRTRSFGSQPAAESLFAHHVRQSAMARAH